mmetsp:Transcript_3701/g.7307  ORF Transcript_3701/g.7307 Transcript_3701/m.7307 type:complete len:658 (-) Transcript_3701:1873-3846(-)
MSSLVKSNDPSLVHVSTPLIVASATPLLLMAFFGQNFGSGLKNTLLVAIARSFTQLMILGLILHPIFVIGMVESWIVFCYVLAMILIATNETLSRPKYIYPYQPLLTFLTILISIGSVGAFAFLVIIRPSPLWNPQYVIPICGMLMGNCINGVSLAISNLSTQIMDGGRREVELCLSFGASGWESVARLVRGAVSVGTTPTLNSMNVIGLVSIPGMMTGQILGGSPVTEAARYQILIMYLISTCSFSTILMNVYIVYRVAFDVGCHVLRNDRFIEVIKKKDGKGIGNTFTVVGDKLKKFVLIGLGTFKACFMFLSRRSVSKKNNFGGSTTISEDSDLLEKQHLTSSKYGTSTNKIRMLSKKLVNNSESVGNDPFLQIVNLEYSTPKTHAKKGVSSIRKLTSQTSITSSPTFGSNKPKDAKSCSSIQRQEQRLLCTDFNANLRKGEINVVKGPSGSGKSTLLRIIAGLTPMDGGDITVDEMSLADCFHHTDHSVHNPDRYNMTNWRQRVRYVTQYKVDIPGTPRDFVSRVASFQSYSQTLPTSGITAPSDDDIISHSMQYLEKWGLGLSTSITDDDGHPYLDSEWKNLSGGECQRVLLAIALSSLPQVLLLDEATSGLDLESERRVEDSVVEYVKTHGAVVLWVTHSEDIAERLLNQD